MTIKNKELLNEENSWAGKLFFASVAAYLGYRCIKGYEGQAVPNLPIKIRASKEELKAIKDVIIASKEYQEEIQRPGATVESVINKLRDKNTAKAKFQQVTNRAWPL